MAYIWWVDIAEPYEGTFARALPSDGHSHQVQSIQIVLLEEHILLQKVNIVSELKRIRGRHYVT